MSIAEQLLESPYREALVADATVVLNSEVADKRGLSGKFVKAGFAMVKGFKPGFIPHAIDDLLGDFVRQIEPFYLRWKESGSSQSCSAYFVANGPSVADALLAITAARAVHTSLADLARREPWRDAEELGGDQRLSG